MGSRRKGVKHDIAVWSVKVCLPRCFAIIELLSMFDVVFDLVYS